MLQQKLDVATGRSTGNWANRIQSMSDRVKANVDKWHHGNYGNWANRAASIDAPSDNAGPNNIGSNGNRENRGALRQVESKLRDNHLNPQSGNNYATGNWANRAA